MGGNKTGFAKGRKKGHLLSSTWRKRNKGKSLAVWRANKSYQQAYYDRKPKPICDRKRAKSLHEELSKKQGDLSQQFNKDSDKEKHVLNTGTETCFSQYDTSYQANEHHHTDKNEEETSVTNISENQVSKNYTIYDSAVTCHYENEKQEEDVVTNIVENSNFQSNVLCDIGNNDNSNINHNVMFQSEVTTNDETCPPDFRIGESASAREQTDLCELTGRRMVDVNHFIISLRELDNHEPFNCKFSDMYIVRESRRGLRSVISFKCRMCNLTSCVSTDPQDEHSMGVNTAAVAASVATGSGFAQLTELTAALNIPSMSAKTFSKYQDKVFDGFEQTALEEMKRAAQEEAKLAIKNGEVDKNGVPVLTVVADGSWPKRSFRNNYSSLSGVAAIVGFRTGKVIFLGWRNKYCTLCKRAENSGTAVKQHTCYKNYNASSTSMESDIIVDGFVSSMEMYGVKYGILVADGDASVYAKILQARPYDDLTVEKVECINHILRNYVSKIRDLVKKGKFGNINLRQKIGSNVLRLRTAVRNAAKYRAAQNAPLTSKLQMLRKDIINSPNHIFGEHKICKELSYFCSGPKDGEVNLVPELRTSGLFTELQKIISSITDHCRSLLKNMNSNIVEQFFSIIAKFLGGKRVNYTQKRSYHGRCTAALVSHNTHRPLYLLHKTMCTNKSPGKYTKLYETRRLRSIQKRHHRTKVHKQQRNETKSYQAHDQHYGPNAEKPDLPEDVYEEKKKEFLASLIHTKEEIVEIERATVLQRESGTWMEERRKLLTASNFGTVCCKRPQTSCQNLVKQLLYANFDSLHLQYGRNHEKDALTEMEKKLDVNITECGLFIDEEIPYLGATPDGLVGTDAIVEVKCPASAKNVSPETAIFSRKVTFWNVNKDKTEIVGINKKHKHFFQIQGQLHITKRDKCYYGVWTPLGMKIEEIYRNDEFWRNEMQEKLQHFYLHCILPELVDPRHRRSLPIREPSYIIEARQALKKRKSTEDDSGIPKARKKLL